MKQNNHELAQAHLGTAYHELEISERDVIDSIADAEPIVENVNELFHDQLSFGQRMADKIAVFGGSWTFIIIFVTVLIAWIFINSLVLSNTAEAFDPYPYILLNLVLSSVAALQAPVIMMSQNRQTQKDRLDITENYKVSLKTDVEIIRLHQKIDALTKMLAEQQKQRES